MGTTSNQHGPYVLGYTHDTMADTKGCQVARRSQSLKVGPSSDRRLQFASLKSESLVIVDQLATVNTFSGLVLTARHTTEVGNARTSLFAAEGRTSDWGKVVTRHP